MSAWSHLPNAKHIDRVIASAHTYPKAWNVGWGVARRNAFDTAWYKIWNAGRDNAWSEAMDKALVPMISPPRPAAQQSRPMRMNAARTAILALVAYDDADKYLSMPSDQLKTWALLSEEPAAVLLLPAVIAFEKISELELI